jgi:hypothetical protein
LALIGIDRIKIDSDLIECENPDPEVINFSSFSGEICQSYGLLAAGKERLPVGAQMMLARFNGRTYNFVQKVKRSRSPGMRRSGATSLRLNFGGLPNRRDAIDQEIAPKFWHSPSANFQAQ